MLELRTPDTRFAASHDSMLSARDSRRFGKVQSFIYIYAPKIGVWNQKLYYFHFFIFITRIILESTKMHFKISL